MKLNQQEIFKALLMCLNESKYLANFTQNAHDYSILGYTATIKPISNIAVMLDGISKSLEQEFSKYDLVEEKLNPANYVSYEELINSPNGTELVAKFDEERTVYNNKKLKEDQDRQAQLETSWNSTESRAQDEEDHKKHMDYAERAAKNIFNKNESFKK